MNIRIRTVAVALLTLALVIELLLLVSGRWLLMGSESSSRPVDPGPWSSEVSSELKEWAESNSRTHWGQLHCTYWTGRSLQTLDYDESDGLLPVECPMLGQLPSYVAIPNLREE